jgi:PAS domain S-box-containing protein
MSRLSESNAGVANRGGDTAVPPLVLFAVGEMDTRENLLSRLTSHHDVWDLTKEPSASSKALFKTPLSVETVTQRPSILIVDDGLADEELESTLEDAQAAGVPVLSVTKPASRDSGRSGHHRADAYLFHPFTEQELFASVKTLLELASLRQQCRLQNQKRDWVIDSFSESFIAVDPDWRVTYINAAAERYLHVRREDALGKPAWDVFDVKPEREAAYRRAMAERVPVSLEALMPGQDWFQIDAIPFEDGGLGVYFRNATQLKKAEAAAQATGQRLRLFLDHADDYALALMDEKKRVVEWLGGTEAITGWSPDEMIGRPIDVLFTDEDVAAGAPEQECRQTAKTGRVSDVRWHQKKDGTLFFADGVNTALRDEAGNLQGFGKIFRDATSQKRAEEALRESQEKLQLVVNSVADGIYVMASDGNCSFLNPAGAAMLGYQPEELVGLPLHDVVHHHHPDGTPYSIDACKIARAVHDGVAIRVDDEVFWRKDGAPLPVHYSVNPVWTEEKVRGAVISFTDITQRKRSEAALRESERRLRFVMDSMPQKVFAASPEGDVVYLNPAWEAFTGLEFNELRDMDWDSVIHPEDLAAHHRAWQHSLEAGAPFQFEHRFRNANGEYRWHLSRALAMRDENGKVVMWIGSNTDIHDVKTAEVELTRSLASERRSAALLADVATASRAINAFLTADVITRVLAEEARSILGARQTIVSLLTERGRVDTVALPDGVVAHQPSGQVDGSGLCSQVLVNGQTMRLSRRELEQHPEWENFAHDCYDRTPLKGWLAAPLLGHGGTSIGLVQVVDKGEGEFTEEDEATLSQLAAIAAVGIENAWLYDSLREQDRRKNEFLATLAHELRNPLAPLQSGLDILQMSHKDEPTSKVREMMARQLTHMVRLVDDLMDVSRVSRGKVELKRSRTRLQEIVEIAVEASAPLVKAHKHDLTVSVPEQPLYVEGDLTRLAQVVSNLLNNATKYTPEGGKIVLSVAPDEDQVIISVKDTGMGLADDMKTTAFDLFTQANPTFGSQGGLGIGLALVKQLVEMHGGTVSAESPGVAKGSTFTVRLPLSRGQQDTAGAGGATAATGASVKRVLVVDDNIDAAEALGTLLALEGHEVAVVHEGRQAIAKGFEFQPDVAFLDLGLPDISGYEVAAALRQETPLKKTVLIALTGWGSEEDRQRSREAGFDLHLTKPVDVKAISTALGRFFSGPA